MDTRSAHEYTMFAPELLCATGVSSGLATRVTVTRMSEDGLLLNGSPCIFIFYENLAMNCPCEEGCVQLNVN
jgi:hypothetical protein